MCVKHRRFTQRVLVMRPVQQRRRLVRTMRCFVFEKPLWQQNEPSHEIIGRHQVLVPALNKQHLHRRIIIQPQPPGSNSGEHVCVTQQQTARAESPRALAQAWHFNSEKKSQPTSSSRTVTCCVVFHTGFRFFDTCEVANKRRCCQ